LSRIATSAFYRHKWYYTTTEGNSRDKEVFFMSDHPKYKFELRLVSKMDLVPEEEENSPIEGESSFPVEPDTDTTPGVEPPSE
jgi:hypothetical protein